MHGKEKIGVVLATYNPQLEYFQKQIQSIQNQTWKNWICHIVDDCSQPQYQAEIKKIVDNDLRFIGHFHSENVKHYYNFERGLKYCAADSTITAIAFSDQDDIWQPEKLEILIAKLRSEQLLLVHSDLELINSQDETINSSTCNFEGRNPEKATVELLLLRNVVTGCSLLFCTSLLTYILPFPQQNEIGWHHDWWVALVAIQKGKIGYIRQSLVRYRLHSSNTVGAMQNAGDFYTELLLWLTKKYRIRGKSYLIHCNLSKAFQARFYHELNSSWYNPFEDERLDFGWAILKLCYQSLKAGYRSEGIALRILIFKILFDIQRVQNYIFKVLPIFPATKSNIQNK
ncbi:MAG: glycosyltransferase [Nostoc sp. NMS2]|uniref:glycosyltransferase n=1 Tax=Nostoc sp. NMS2 TaxID=2815389 RepID=UPI0025DFB081|nr:glycosyltransferase [Nostoc sp. NMS2]MBN3992485.1 glycosyltransferase [Nostoc sp. NMS2]